jgi:hypothetical protein
VVKWINSAPIIQRLGIAYLHAFGRSFLVKGRHPFALLLLPDGRGDNTSGLLLAAAGCILGRGIGHHGRIFIQPKIGKVRQREAVDHASRVNHALATIPSEMLIAFSGVIPSTDFAS